MEAHMRPFRSGRTRRLHVVFALVFFAPLVLVRPAGAQTAAPAAPQAVTPRPIPYPMETRRQFAAAVENGTRTLDGAPGPKYWQQSARYAIDARVDPEAKRVEGTTRVVYHNQSPRPLPVLGVMLYQNLHAEGAERHESQEVTGGMEIRGISVEGQQAVEVGPGRRSTTGPRYQVAGTRAGLWLPSPLAPGDSATFDVDWAFKIPQAGANGRMGWNSDDLVYLAYWYPQMAVYDDVVGWHQDPFLGRAEFYMGYADYDVRLTAPEGWVVVGTGVLQNPGEVLPAPVRERIRRAEASDSVVHVLTEADFGPGRATTTSPEGVLTWHYRADHVRDVAFSLTRASLWDAVRTDVGDRDGDGETDYARIDALWRPAHESWAHAAEYGRHAIATLSRWIDMPYPWSHMSIVEGTGIIGGGMEYPMMTLIGGFDGAPEQAFYGVVAHELGHMWFPMIVGSDEVRWGWMDEGLTSFNTTIAVADRFEGSDPDASEIQQYVGAAKAGYDGEMMRWTDWEYPQSWGVASYPKPSSALIALRSILGEETFTRAFREYARRWAWKHPKPEDFFHTMSSVSGTDLDWFWRSWFWEEWLMDQSVAAVERNDDGTIVRIRDLGDLPMPARVKVVRADGSEERLEVPVSRWLSGARDAELRVGPGAEVVSVELDPDHVFPDADRSNDTWTAGD
jgi:hypothetical protein